MQWLLFLQQRDSLKTKWAKGKVSVRFKPLTMQSIVTICRIIHLYGEIIQCIARHANETLAKLAL